MLNVLKSYGLKTLKNILVAKINLIYSLLHYHSKTDKYNNTMKTCFDLNVYKCLILKYKCNM